jgi:hypothetical protein
MADPINYCSWLVKSFCVTQSEWASWTQAVTSVLAIAAAARIATSQERRSIARRTDVVVNLISMADIVGGSIPFASVGDFGYLSKQLGRRSPTAQIKLDLDQIQKALRSVELHDLPDYRLLPQVTKAAQACTDLLDLVDEVPEGHFIANQAFLQRLSAGQRTLKNAYEQASEIGNSVAPWRPIEWMLRHYRRARLKKRLNHAAS